STARLLGPPVRFPFPVPIAADVFAAPRFRCAPIDARPPTTRCDRIPAVPDQPATAQGPRWALRPRLCLLRPSSHGSALCTRGGAARSAASEEPDRAATLQ